MIETYAGITNGVLGLDTMLNVSYILSFTSSAANPIIYFIFSQYVSFMLSRPNLKTVITHANYCN